MSQTVRSLIQVFCFSGVLLMLLFVVVCLALSCLFGLGSWFFQDPQFSFVSICCRVSPQGCMTISWNRKCLTIIPSRLHPVTSLSDSYLVALSPSPYPTASFFKFLRPPSLACILTVASSLPVPVLRIWAGFPASHQANNAHDHFLIFFIEAVLLPQKIPGLSTTGKVQSNGYLSSHHLSFISLPCLSTEYCTVNTITLEEKSGRNAAWRCFRTGVAWDADGCDENSDICPHRFFRHLQVHPYHGKPPSL